MSSLTTDNSEAPDAEPGAFKDNTSNKPSFNYRLKTYIYQIGKCPIRLAKRPNTGWHGIFLKCPVFSKVKGRIFRRRNNF